MARYLLSGMRALAVGAALWFTVSVSSAQVVTLAEEGDLRPLLSDKDGQPVSARRAPAASADDAVDADVSAARKPVPVPDEPEMPRMARVIATDSDNRSEPQRDVVQPPRAEADPQREVIRERYPNREVKIEREVTQDAEGNYINHGNWKMLTPSGELVAEGRYHYGERQGLWSLRAERDDAPLFASAPYDQFDGPFVSQATFEAGRLSGQWTIYDSRQRKISQWNFVDGQRDGKSIWNFPDGRPMRELDFRRGLLEGDGITWNPDGKVTGHEQHRDGRKIVTKTEYFPDGGQKRSEGTYLQGKLTLESPDDWWKSQTARFKVEGDDQRDGTWTSWYSNGQMQVQGVYKEGQQWGKFTWWYASGQKQAEGQFVGGKPQGLFTWWHPNGQKQRQGRYAAGVPTGLWNTWSADGQLVGKEVHASSLRGEEPSVAADETDSAPVENAARAADPAPHGPISNPRAADQRFRSLSR